MKTQIIGNILACFVFGAAVFGFLSLCDILFDAPDASSPPPAGSEIGRARVAVVSPAHGSLAPPIVSDRALYDAIREVESGGDDYAVGDEANSLGPYQISYAYFKDAAKHAGVDWDYGSSWMKRDRCEYLMDAYWSRYGAVTAEQKARCHNSGSKWRAKYHLTNDYWAKVRLLLERN